jgi:hypothetical protein
MTEVCQEDEKLQSDKCDLYSNRQKPGRSLYKRAITKCDRKCIEGDEFEYSCHSGNPTYVIGDPVN